MEYKIKTNPSFLSPNVRHLLVDVGKEYRDKVSDEKHSFLAENGTFMWKNVGKLLGDIGDDFKIQNQSKSWFLSTVSKLWNVFHEAHCFLVHCERSSQDTLWNLCAWTGKQEELKEYYEHFISKDVSTAETTLYLTAVLERSFGNLYLLKGSQVPSLLRDLLETSELLSILGHIPITFLQILMGTPSALNLRNIVWHGFPRPDEISPELVSTLFLVTASVGEIVNTRNICVNLIPARSQVCYGSEFFLEYFPDVSDQCFYILKTIHQCDFIDYCHETYWEAGVKHITNGEYGPCLQLLMPQIEHLLRCMFCTVNDCPNRMLTAESTTLYTTLSEIMAEQITINDESKENKLWNVLGDNILEMLQDLFLHQAGPRIRDKIGHGECNLSETPKHLANHVMCVALVIILRSREFDYSGLDLNQVEHFDFSQTSNNSNKTIDLLEVKLMDCYKLYASIYHPSSLLKRSIIRVIDLLDEWGKHPRPILDETSPSELVPYTSGNFLQLQNIIHKSLRDLNFELYNTSEGICQHVSSVKIQTTFRPRAESEIVSILSHIVHNIQLISSQVNLQLSEKFLSFSQHKMRSRNRITYQRMLDVIPCLKQMMLCIVLVLVIWLHKINSVIKMPQKEYTQSLKFLRKNLQFVENVSSYTNQDKNRWTETSLLVERFCQDLCFVLKPHCYLLKK